jgi:hypothetical protein
VERPLVDRLRRSSLDQLPRSVASGRRRRHDQRSVLVPFFTGLLLGLVRSRQAWNRGNSEALARADIDAGSTWVMIDAPRRTFEEIPRETGAIGAAIRHAAADRIRLLGSAAEA